MIIEDIPPGDYFHEKSSALFAEVKDAAELLNTVLTHQDYLVNGHFSAADIGVSYHLYFCKLWPELKVIIDAYPYLNRYLERVMARPAAVKAKVFTFEE